MWYDSQITQGILKRKYLHSDESTFEEFINRVTSIYSKSVSQRLKKAMYNQEFCPAGRILYGAGAKGKFRATTSNCFILDKPEDSIESIYETNKKMARIFSYGGGCGLNISNLRPKGAKVNNSAGSSTGAVSFLNIFNETGNVIGSNGRRAAILVGLECSHPDIYEYLHIKENDEKLESMNISILFTDEFMEAVEQDKEYTLKFDVKATGEHIERTIKARDFFKEYCEVNRDYGDPGALFIDTARRDQLLSGYEEYKIDISNPCVTGETKILTDQGYKRIDSLVGTECNVWNGYQYSRVTPRVTGHNQKMVRVYTSNGMSLDCTLYHKFVLANGERVEAQDLHIGDKLKKWAYPVIEGNLELSNAYTKGFYSGDGTTGREEIALYGEKKNLIDRINHIGFNASQNRILCRLVEDTYVKTFVPDHNFTISSRLEWLAGIIDSDGNRNGQEGSITISSINFEFLSNIQLMLTTLGVHSTISLVRKEGDRLLPKNDGTGDYQYYHCANCYRLIISAFYVKKLIDLGFITYRVDISNINPNRNAQRFITITKIEAIPDSLTVYCFNEPINHTGIFNGIMTAQCAEYLGNAYNSCLLSSMNLYSVIDDKFTDKARVNHKRLEKLTRLGIDELDETLDYGLDVLPLQENKDCAREWRSIGLGVFGLGDALVALGIKYGSKESLQIVDDMFETIFLTALDESANLARRKGAFPKYDWNKTKQSPFIKGIEFAYPTLYNKIKKYGLRNGTLLSIAPSGTISLFMGSFTGGCEPLFKLFYDRTTHSMENKHKTFRVYAASIHDLVKFHNLPEDISIEELKDRFPFLVESHDVDPIDRVHMQEIIQNYVDNAVSSTVNLPEGTGADTIYKIYMQAWKSKCKGITVFVDGCKRGNILGVKKDDKKKSENDGNDRLEVVDKDFITPKYNTVLPAKRRNKEIVSGYTLKESTACVPQMYVTVNTDDDDVYEVFTNASTGCRANINTITRLISLALRSGIKVDKIIEELRANQCPACQTLIKQGRKVSLSCANAMADAIEVAIKNNKKNTITTPLVKEEETETKTEDKNNDSELLECPECHNKTLKPEAKCCVCSVCGYSKCE